MRQVIPNELIEKNKNYQCANENKTLSNNAYPTFQSLAIGAIKKNENNDVVQVRLDSKGDNVSSSKSAETIVLTERIQEIDFEPSENRKKHSMQNTDDNIAKPKHRLFKASPLKRVYKRGENRNLGERSLLKWKRKSSALDQTSVSQGNKASVSVSTEGSHNSSCSRTQPCSIISGEFERKRHIGTKIIHPTLSSSKDLLDEISRSSDSEDDILQKKIDDTIAEFEIIYKDGSSILQESDISTDDTFALYSPHTSKKNSNHQTNLKRIRSESFVSALAAEYRNSGLDINIFDRTESGDIDDDLSFASNSVFEMSDNERDLFEARRFALRNYNLLFDISNFYPMNLQKVKNSYEPYENDSHDLAQLGSLVPTQSFRDESSIHTTTSTQHVHNNGKIMNDRVLAFIDLIRAIVISIFFHSLLLKKESLWEKFCSLGVFIICLLPAISKLNTPQPPLAKNLGNISRSSNNRLQLQKAFKWIKYLIFSKSTFSILVYIMAWCFICEKVQNSLSGMKRFNKTEESSQIFAIEHKNETNTIIHTEGNNHHVEGKSIQENFDHANSIKPISSDGINLKSTQYTFIPASIQWHDVNLHLYQKTKSVGCNCELSDTLSKSKDLHDVKSLPNELHSDIEEIIRKFVKTLLDEMRRAVQQVMLIIYDCFNAVKLVAQKVRKTISGMYNLISNVLLHEKNNEMMDTIYEVWAEVGID